jgi:hypothetical protein
MIKLRKTTRKTRIKNTKTFPALSRKREAIQKVQETVYTRISISEFFNPTC